MRVRPQAIALGILALFIFGCASEVPEPRPAPAVAKLAKSDSDHYLRYVAFELPFGDAVLLRWSERQMPLKIFLPPPPDGLFSDPESYRSAVREGVVGWSEVAGPGLPRFEFVDAIGDADIPITWARERQGDWYIAQTMLNVVPSQRRFDVAQLIVTARWQNGHFASPEDVHRVVLHEMGHALGFAGHSPDPGDIMYATVSAADLSDRDRATLAALYARPVGARITGSKGTRLR
jgi:predicted Zn-dependent protease